MPGTVSPASSDPTLAQLLEAGRVEVGCFTDEELQAVGADREAPFQRSPAPDRVSSQPEDLREPILATALRSLIARGVVRPPTEEQLAGGEAEGQVDLDTTGELQFVLSVRSNPSMLAFVGQEEYFGMLHGLQPDQGGGFLEERVSPQGLHYFTVFSRAAMVEWLVSRVDPRGLTPDEVLPPQGRQALPPAVTEAIRVLAPGATRLDAYHRKSAGDRRIRFGVHVAPDATWVVTSAFGVDPQLETALRVDQAGLRANLSAVLTDSDPSSGG
ncbi:MAG: hypothetical protein J2P28_13670 [Actinobacteria bacterium]|nr:hypothetical protein [Actinomycetota bacterium]